MIRRPYKILLLDDEPVITDVLEEMLSGLYGRRFELFTTNESEDAMEIIEKEDINILITDLSMPRISGENLIMEVSKLSKGVQVIVLSGTSSYVIALNCYLDGAAGFILKPFNEKNIKMVMDMCLQRLEFWDEFLNTTMRARKKKE